MWPKTIRRTTLKRALDRIDEQLIELLQKNARMSNKELAAKVGLAPSTCFERVRRLEETGVFIGYHAAVDLKKLGSTLEAMVAVRLTKHSAALVNAFTEHALSLPEVREVYHVAGINDFMLHVVVKDSDHLRMLVMKDISSRDDIAHVETALVFEHTRNDLLPFEGLDR